MTPAAITALPALQLLQQLKELKWLESEPRQDKDHPCADTADTLAQLAHLTQLTHITLGRAQAATTSLIAAVTGMTNLMSFTMGSAAPILADVRWEVLSSRHLSQLLTSCTLLTTLSMEEVVLDQAGLDLLLAHPHIVNVTLLAIAATESRVDSPCSWQTLTLARQVDIRTVAYVPLHSLQQPLNGDQLLLPPDVPSDQLPQLLLKAATRIAEQSHLLNIRGDCLALFDCVIHLASKRMVQWHGAVQPAFSPTEQSALLAALAPLAGISKFQELMLSFHRRPSTGMPPWLRVGKTDLETLDRTWGSRITSLWLEGVSLAPGFFPALETCFPQLSSLWLEHVEPDTKSLAPRIVLFWQRMTRPMTIYVDDDALYE
jgi:hypothetical protein